MATKPKIFLSYSTSDRTIASSLYKDLSNIGADVFQFEKTATPGQPSWNEVLTRIEMSDIFILLASKNSVKSRPVQEEIKFAHYQFLNANKPSILLPLVLEPNLQLPKEIRANNFIAFHDYNNGFSQLSKFLKPETITPSQTNNQASTTLNEGSRRADVSETQLKSRLQLMVNSLPKLNHTSITENEMLWYAVIILLIGIGGAFIGKFANSFLLHINSNSINGAVATWSKKYTWLFLSSKLFCWSLLAYRSYESAVDEYPIDKLDYAVLAAGNVILALIIGMVWSFLFIQVAIETYPFIIICIAISTITLLVYAIKDQYF